MSYIKTVTNTSVTVWKCLKMPYMYAIGHHSIESKVKITKESTRVASVMRSRRGRSSIYGARKKLHNILPKNVRGPATTKRTLMIASYYVAFLTAVLRNKIKYTGIDDISLHARFLAWIREPRSERLMKSIGNSY